MSNEGHTAYINSQEIGDFLITEANGSQDTIAFQRVEVITKLVKPVLKEKIDVMMR